MVAGGGMWHGGGWAGDAGARGFQLWVALPPELEQGDAASTYLAPAVDPARRAGAGAAWPLRGRKQ